MTDTTGARRASARRAAARAESAGAKAKRMKAAGEAKPAAVTAAQTLRGIIKAQPDGSYLGLESSLIADLGVSRPTFREAARLLAHEQLLEVRCGVGGGYFARRPTVKSVSHNAATYLELAETSMMDLMNASNALVAEAVRLAASQTDPEKRAGLARATETLRVDRPRDLDSFFQEDGEFTGAIIALANNPAIDLFVRTLSRFGFREASRRVFGGRPDRIELRRVARVKLGEVILMGHAEVAVNLCNQHYDIARSWMEEEVEGPDPLRPVF